MKYLFLVSIFVVCWTSYSFAQTATEAESETQSGLLVTFPHTVHLNSSLKVCFTAVNLTGLMMVQARLLYNTALCLPLISDSWSGSERDGCVELSTDCPYAPFMERVNPPTSGELTLMLIGRTQIGINFIQKSYEKAINVVPLKTQTFIQTDKPMYQPGQKVLFRVLTVQYPDMLPDTDNVKDVWITSPSGTRMQQWRGQVSDDGLLDLTFELSSEPKLGTWTIHVEVHGGVETTQGFDVEEYVLPKFEVLITPPSYLSTGNNDEVTVKICAMYTYGQPVRGRIAANITTSGRQRRSSPGVFFRGYGFPPPHVISREVEANDATGCGEISFYYGELQSPSWGENKLIVRASFTERGTGIELTGVSDSTPIVDKDIVVEIQGPDVFKPLLPYHGKIVVTYPDGSPAGVKSVQVSFVNKALQFLETQPDGTVNFSLDTPHASSTTNLHVSARLLLWEASVVIYTHSRATKIVRAWYSPSGSFLQISDIVGLVSINQSVPVQLDFTLPQNETQMDFFYRVVSGGRIVASGSHQWNKDNVQSATQSDTMSAQSETIAASQTAISTSASSRSQRQRRSSPPYWGHDYETIEPELPNYATNGTKASTTFSFNAIAEMSPKSQLLVYHIRKDGEVVSASTNFKMASALKNQVSIEFPEGSEVKPGQTASMAVNAQPSSLCAVGVVDKSVHIMGGNNQLSKAKVMDPLSGLNVIQGSRATNCPTESSSTFSSKHADSLEGFRTAGVGVVTDLQLETRPCWERRRVPCDSWRCRVYHSSPDPMFGGPMAMRPLDSQPGPRGPEIVVRMNSPVLNDNFMISEVGEVEEEEAGPLTQLRSYFPETWLWKLARLGTDGQHVIEEEIPHTITDWVASAFCLSSEHGVGVAETETIRAFQPFFLSYTIPYSVIRGEKVPLKVTVFNYFSSCLNIQVTMTESSDFDVEARPASETIEVCGNSAETLEYEIRPRELGDMPIRVTASAEPSADRGDMPIDDVTFPVTDALEDTILVEPEGAEREETFSELICPDDSDDGVYQKTIPLQLPAVIVPGSARGRVQVIGDIMGSVMSNLDSLLRMPYGCGEQNMIFMAPNIYVMQYLSFTNQLTADIKEKALGFMNSGYQREQNYQLLDHSYSAFGQSDGVGSTWLTAFVLKCFSQAQDFMDIDQDDLDQTRQWLANNPRDENGCVVTRGRVIHKEMQGSVTSPVTQTAFVTIALLEAGAEPQDVSVVQGLQCIRNGIESEGSEMNTYTLAISSYALGLGEDYTTQSDALDYLNQRALGEDGLRYWSKSDTPDVDPSRCVSHCRADSADVEITAYVLLANLRQELEAGEILREAIPIMKWLNTQRNALGGFASTQDTVVGLQALSQFASIVYDPNTPQSMSLLVNGTRVPPNVPQLHSFRVETNNRLVLQREELEEVPTNLSLTATGSGCALFQAELLYNVPVVQPTRVLFNITATIRDWEGNSIPDPTACGDKTMDICVRYTGSGEETGMATMEVKMVSGYIPHEQSLTEFQDRHGNRIGLKRFDKYKAGQPLSLYFDKFDDENRCVTLNLKQEIFVKEAKDAVIKVYDYYKPAVVGYKSYNTCEADN